MGVCEVALLVPAAKKGMWASLIGVAVVGSIDADACERSIAEWRA